MKIHLTAMLVCMALVAPVSAREYSARVTLHVVDEEGRPISGAKAAVSFVREYASRESERVNTVRGVSDVKGLVTFEGKTAEAGIGHGAEKEGHYGIRGTNYQFTSRGVLRLSPWNPTIEVVLKRIKHPVPMYAKRVLGEVPAKDADVGYDLVMGDWVAPYGSGKTPDMVFFGQGVVTNNRNYEGTLSVTFPGKGNGLIPFEVSQPRSSPLRMPYEAPAEGYESGRSWRSMRKYNATKMVNEGYINETSGTQNYFIRLRTELDAEGKVVRALYGKIHAPFDFDPRGSDPSGATKRQFVSFTYYVNPDGTRNIEYDSKRNLLKSPKRHDPDYEDLAP